MVPDYYNIIHMNTNTNNHKTSYSITRGLFFLIMCSVIFTVLYYSLPRQNREPAISDYIDFSEGWTTSDGSPVDFSHISGTCTVTKKLPALTHDMALFFFYKSSNVTILIDDRLIYETMQPESVFFGKTPGASYVSLPIYREDSGRTLTLVIDNPYGDGSGKINHMYLGRSDKVQTAYNENLKELKSKGMLPLFDAGYINLSRQYLTIGVNGLVEAAEFLGIRIDDNDDYVAFVQNVLGLIERYNKKYRTKELMFNCEMIPAENVGVKHAKWDREDGYAVPRDCYNSYFYVVEDTTLNIADKFRLHGAQYISHLTGGSALHMNLEEHLSQPQYRHLLRVAAQEGCNYFTFNIPNTVCNDCGHIDKRYLKECPRCHSTNLDYLTRVIGYMKRISNFSQARQQEAARRYYNRPERIEGGVEERSVAAPRRDE